MFKQAWFYVTLLAVAAVAFLLYTEFTAPRQAPGGPPPQVARESESVPPATSEPSPEPARSEADLVALGQRFYTQLGCAACHSLDGTPLVGPSWAGLFGRERPLASGETVVADEEYIRLAIEDPDAQIVQGYPQGVMTATIAPFRAQLAERETIDALIAFIKSLE